MRLVACLMLLMLVCAPALAQSEIPAESLDKLQNVLAGVCERLWENNDEFFHDGQFERCIANLRLITEIDPRDVQAYSDGAWMMGNVDRDWEGELFLLRGIENNSDSPDLYFDTGFFYYLHGRYAQAAYYLEGSTFLQPHWRTWHSLAHAYERIGDISDALSIWLMLEDRDPIDRVPTMQIDRILSGEKEPFMPTRSLEQPSK